MAISFVVQAEQTGTIVITSSPVGCEVTIENVKSADSLSIKGGEILDKTSPLLKIRKVDSQLNIGGIPKGKYEIILKRGDTSIKSEINIQEDKASLIKGNFSDGKAFIIPQVFIAKDGAPMVLVPAGEFQMGSDIGDIDEKPIHKVYLDEFYIDVYEVTNEQYRKFIDATKHEPSLYWDDPKCNAPDQPVVGVTWQDAVDYCKWAGKRLPTEAEWEKSARGGLVGKQYPLGDDENIEETPEPMAQENPGLNSAYPVGCFKPNAYGLHDMERNAWEWCHDWYGEEYYANSSEKNPQGPDTGDEKVLRGGSWFSGIYTPLPVSYRYRFDPEKSSVLIGFRCVSKKD